MDYWKVGNEDDLVSTTTSYNAATGEDFSLDIRCPVFKRGDHIGGSSGGCADVGESVFV